MKSFVRKYGLVLVAVGVVYFMINRMSSTLTLSSSNGTTPGWNNPQGQKA